jgi:hypothetical protein
MYKTVCKGLYHRVPNPASWGAKRPNASSQGSDLAYLTLREPEAGTLEGRLTAAPGPVSDLRLADIGLRVAPIVSAPSGGFLFPLL